MSLTRLCRQTMTVENPDGTRGKHGEVAVGSPSTVYCRFERTQKTILNANGEREPIHGAVIALPTDTFAVGAKITYSSQVYKLMQIDEIPGRNGNNHHFELLVQLWSFSS